MTIGLFIRDIPSPSNFSAETISWQSWREQLGIPRWFFTFSSNNLVQAIPNHFLALFSFICSFSSSVVSRNSLSKLTSDYDHVIAQSP